MNETIKLGVVLLLVTAIAGGVLAGVNSVTAPVIAEREKMESLSAILELFPDANDSVEYDEGQVAEVASSNPSITEVTQVLKDGEVLGYAMTVVTGGYAGDIRTLVGVDSEGALAGIKVLVMSETAGLGSRIVDDPAFAESFQGKGAGGSVTPSGAGAGDDEVMMLSGATVSTNAVVKGVNEALDAFASNLSN
ncbi:RnfABCDGE type electron transport complex subunit G [Gudongella sp. SC589]|jgi:electron transport complex protein RnfG|uniref:RnfABCDGE type electron transport complex subunit G n=1 Tax=Gudongella sp. SC589 TaxID=3385990 RepID=UPI0039047764